MKSGIDVWYCYNCQWNGRIEDAQDGQPCPRCNEYSLNPDYPQSRVKGGEYMPYQGGSRWEKLANAAMKEQAAYNFRNAQAH